MRFLISAPRSERTIEGIVRDLHRAVKNALENDAASKDQKATSKETLSEQHV
jgi:hypothetical protein